MPAPSEQLAIAPPAPANSVLPVLGGSVVEGQTLTASTGTWSGSPTSYTYQWQDCNSWGEAAPTSPAPAPAPTRWPQRRRHTPSASVVTAGNAGGPRRRARPRPRRSPRTCRAPRTPRCRPSPGPTVQGQTLSTTNGSWTGSPTSYAYQWQDCNSSGASCANITSASSCTYTLASSDVGTPSAPSSPPPTPAAPAPASSAETATITAQAAPRPTPPCRSSAARPYRTDAERQQRVLDRQPHLLHLPVAGLQQLRRSLRQHQRRHLQHLHAATSDVGHTIRVVVTATNTAANQSQLRGNRDRLRAPPAPTNTALPVGERVGGGRPNADARPPGPGTAARPPTPTSGRTATSAVKPARTSLARLGELHARPHRRRTHHPRGGDSNERGRVHEGVLRGDGGRRGGGAGGWCSAGCEWSGGGRSDADREYGIVVRQPDVLRVPVAGLQQLRCKRARTSPAPARLQLQAGHAATSDTPSAWS